MTPVTHCRRGHEYTQENTYRGRLGRQCNECRKLARATRDFADRQAAPERDLTPAQVRRLKEALADGVTIVDLAARFGLHHDAVVKFREAM